MDATYQLSRHHEAELSANLEQDCADLIDAVFVNADFGGRSFLQQRHHVRICVHDDGGKLVGHMAVLHRAVRVEDALWDIMGLAEVVTHRDHRKQGIASAMLQDAIALAEARRCHAMLLFGVERIYTSAGFMPVDNPIRYVEMMGCTTGQPVDRREHALMVLPLSGYTWNGEAHVDLLGHIF